MRYIQTAAQCQLTDGGMSYDELKEKKRAFILSRFKMEVLKPLRSYEPLTAITFPSESRGFSFIRCYGLEQDGITVARAISMWALLDTDTRALVPVNNFELGLTVLPPIDLNFDHLKFPSTLSDIGTYGVHYGDVDKNMHMNNTKYPDMYSNFLPLENKMIKSISINYRNEAQIGEKLRIQRAFENGTYLFRTIRGDQKVNSEASIELTEIT
jgi:acyl-ACP thioesterase